MVGSYCLCAGVHFPCLASCTWFSKCIQNFRCA